jgi:tripartite-type tricarboxylate transporter receptor subunit TctC
MRSDPAARPGSTFWQHVLAASGAFSMHAIRSLLTLALIACAGTAAAQTAKPVTIVVPFAGGGPTDTVARVIAPAMSKELGAPIAIENLGGGGGTVGAARVAKAQNDGSVLLLHNIGHATAQALYAKLTFDPLGDFVAVGRVADVPMTVVARSNLPPKDAKELIAFIKSQGRKLNLGHAGIGAASHLCGLLLMRAIGTPMSEVPYKGTGPAMTDLLSGQLDLMCDQTTNTLTQIGTGRIKAYAVTSSTRLPALKDTPTLVEAGLKNFEVTVWHGLYAPRGTPADVVDRTAKALQAALRDPEVLKRLGELSATPPKANEATPAALQAWTKSESARWTQVIKASGVKPE